MSEPIRLIDVTREPIDSRAVLDAVRDDAAGALVLFEGTTRDIALLRYEVYEPMALARLRHHAEQAVARFGLAAVAVVHRVGDVPLQETSVSIAAAAPHRPEAFAAARFLIDAIKADVPIWKQEIDEAAGSERWGVSEQRASLAASALRVGIVTASDSCARDEAAARDDATTPAVARMLGGAGHDVCATRLVADDVNQIAHALTHLVDDIGVDVIITTGGTGLGPRDVTADATRTVIDREVPGLAEMLRASSALITDRAWLSRGIAGIRGQTLIVNVPGSPRAAGECTELLLPLLEHACAVIRGADHRMRTRA